MFPYLQAKARHLQFSLRNYNYDYDHDPFLEHDVFPSDPRKPQQVHGAFQKFKDWSLHRQAMNRFVRAQIRDALSLIKERHNETFVKLLFEAWRSDLQHCWKFKWVWWGPPFLTSLTCKKSLPKECFFLDVYILTQNARASWA